MYTGCVNLVLENNVRHLSPIDWIEHKHSLNANNFR